jgi:hypothetical protein
MPHADKVEAITAEAGQLNGHPWAGKYYAGDGTGFNFGIVIAPASGFVYTWSGCMGLYNHNHGLVAQDENHLTLIRCEPEEDENGRTAAPAELVVVPWGERTYLLRPDELTSFYNAVNAGDEPREGSFGSFLLREDDWKKKAEGVPDIPLELRPWLRSEPLKARIAAVGKTRGSGREWEVRQTAIRIDVGRHDGVFVGMEFNVAEPGDHILSTVRVVQVGERQSLAHYEEMFVGKQSPRPVAGWKLSSRRKHAEAAPAREPS